MSTRWQFCVATIVGLGFNVKMLEAFLPLPAFYPTYLAAALLFFACTVAGCGTWSRTKRRSFCRRLQHEWITRADDAGLEYRRVDTQAGPPSEAAELDAIKGSQGAQDAQV